MTSPLPAPLHAQAVALYARRVSVHAIARRVGRPVEQVKQAVGWQPWSRKRAAALARPT